MQRVKTKKKNNPRIELTKAERRKLVRQVSDESFYIFLAAVAEEFDWGEDEIERCAERLNKYNTAVKEGLITPAEIKKLIQDEYGIEIK